MPNTHGHQSEHPSRLEPSTASNVTTERKFPFPNTKPLVNFDDSNKENQPARPWHFHSDFQPSNNLRIPTYQEIHDKHNSNAPGKKRTFFCNSNSDEINDALQQKEELSAPMHKSSLLDKLTMLKGNYVKPNKDLPLLNSIINKDTNKNELSFTKRQNEAFASNQKSNLATISECASRNSDSLPHSTVPSTTMFQSQKTDLKDLKTRLNSLYVTPKDRICTNALSTCAKPKKRSNFVATKSISAPLKPLFMHADRSFLHQYQPSASSSKKIEESEGQDSASRRMRSYSSLPHCQASPSFDDLPLIVQKLQRVSAVLSKFPMRAEPGTCVSEESDDDDDDEDDKLSWCSESEDEDLPNNGSPVNDAASSKLKETKEPQKCKSSVRPVEHQEIQTAHRPMDLPDIQKELKNINIEKKPPLQNCEMGSKDNVSFNQNNRAIQSEASKNAGVEIMAANKDSAAKNNIHVPSTGVSMPLEIKPMHFLPTTDQNVKANRIITVNKKNYLKLNILGKGGSSKVYLVYDEETKQLLAVKKVCLIGADPPIVKGYKNEISLLCKLQQCDRVIKLFDYEYCSGDKEILVVMEKGDTDLSTVLRSVTSSESLTPVMIKFYWSEMLKAVKEIHEHGIIHSDLKPANFLLVSGKLKLIDFGISSSVQKDETSVFKDCQAGTINFMPPEAIQNRCHQYDQRITGEKMIKINRKADIWSLGCILYNLVYGKTPFQHIPNALSKLQAIVNPNYKIEFPPIQDTALLHLLKICLIRDPSQRPSIDDLLKHPYLKSETYTADVPMSSRLSSVIHQIQELTPRRLDQVAQIVTSLRNSRRPKDA